MRLGSNEGHEGDVRIWRPRIPTFESWWEKGRFREDLYIGERDQHRS